MRTRLAAISLLALAALAIAAVSSARSAGSGWTIHTKGWIEAIDMQGGTVAYDVAAPNTGCNRLFVRRGGKTTSVGGKVTCRADSTSTGAGVREIALAGPRIAWIVNIGGNTESQDTLLTSSLAKPKEKQVAEATRTGDVDSVLTGDWLGGLVGRSNAPALFAYNAWSTDGSGQITTAALRRNTGASTALVADGPETLRAASISGPRIAVLHTDGSVVLFASDGSGLLGTIQPPAQTRAIALDGTRLAVLTKGSKLELYNATNQAPLASLGVAPGSLPFIDMSSEIVVYATGHRLRALSISSGNSAVLATVKRNIKAVEIEPAGIVYYWNTVSGIKSVGVLSFIPMQSVAAALG